MTAPGVFATTPVTPDEPLAPTPVGKETCVELPTFDFHSGLIVDR